MGNITQSNCGSRVPDPASYTNPGLTEGLRDVNILGLRVDSWYYDDERLVGNMNLGQGGVAPETSVAAFLCHQLAAFLAGFGLIARLRSPLFGTYQMSLPSARVHTFTVDIDGEDALSCLENGMTGFPYVTGLHARFDINAALRLDNGATGRCWLLNVGDLQLAADVRGNRYSQAVEEGLAQWTAYLRLGVISVFQADNSAILEQVRESWRQLRAGELSLIRANPEASSLPLIVTLIKPPDGTPPDNRELYEINAPALSEAIGSWQRITGHPFLWEETSE